MEDKILAFFTSKTRVSLILSKKCCTSEEQGCSQVSKFIIKLQINYFVLKCLKFFFKYSEQQTLKIFPAKCNHRAYSTKCYLIRLKVVLVVFFFLRRKIISIQYLKT